MVKDNRKIAAILAADVVEYSRLMGADEPGTFAALKIRRAIFDELVREFDGHEFGSVGDSLMAQFPSAVNAVLCAQAIQQRLESENSSLPPAQRMHLRIGVNLGDVIEEQGTAFGDTVNVAARLQSLAKPGGVLISRSVHDQVHLKIPAHFITAGVHHVKNIPEPVACYEVTKPVVASFGQRVTAVLKGRVVITATIYSFLSLLIVAAFKKFAMAAGAPAWGLATVITALAAGLVFALAVASRLNRRYRLWLLAMVTGLTAIVIVAGWQWWDAAEKNRNPRSAREEKSIAVLPFVDLSAGKNQEYFADGLAEDVINLLGRIPALKVIGRTSSFQFKGRNEDLRAIGAELGAAYVLEGSVRRLGDRVRVTAQLIGTQDGVRRWSETYDRAFGDVLKLEDELAAGLARALEVDVGAGTLQARTALTSPEAYDFYLRALHAADRRDREGFEAAANYLQQALQLDPTFAAATAELAFVLMAQADFGYAPVGATYERARHTAEAAIRLDPKTDRPHAVLAWIHMAYDWDWPAADVELKRAFVLMPHDTLVLKFAGQLSKVLGHWDEAAGFLSASVARDPLDSGAYTLLSGAYLRAGRLDEAEVAARKVLEFSPTYATGARNLGLVLLARGRREEALAAMQSTTYEVIRTAGLVSAYHALGRQADSDAALAWLTREHASDNAFAIAEAHAFRGEVDEAFRWLDRAYAQKDKGLYLIKGDPLLKRLEGNLRYQAFLHKMKLPE
jgi:TolB-like protein/class 3 adenylate cyclase